MKAEICDIAPSDWTIRRIDSVCSRVTSGGTPSRKNPRYFENGTWGWVKTQELQDCWIEETDERITDEAICNSSAKVLPANAVLLALYGATVGQLGLLRSPMTCNQACCAMLVDEHLAHYRYLFYQLLHHRRQLKQLATGAAQQNLSGTLMKAFELPFPKLTEQRAIASTLSSLDDKIEQNRRTGGKLEELARAVFKAWFVDFEPVKAKASGETSFPGMSRETFAALPTRFTNSDVGPVPEGWEVRSLYSTAKFINGAAFKSTHFCDPRSGIPVVKIAELKAGITEQTKYSSRADLDSRYRINTGDILYSWSGSPDTSLDTFIWTKGPGLLNQHIFRVVAESHSQKVFVYYLLRHLKQDLIEIARNKQTTGLGHVTVGDMQRLLFAYPDRSTLDGFAEVIGPVFAVAFNGLLESEKLVALRDYLLPRLLSGKVRVQQCDSLTGGQA